MAGPIITLAQNARGAARGLATTSVESRNAALEAIVRELEAAREQIEAANREDLAAASEMVEKGELAAPLVPRLDVSGGKFAEKILKAVRGVEQQPDPLGRTQSATELDEGLELFRVSVPIGVLGVIFESRPDALVQIAALCLKSGNAVLLKGGREALRTNQVLAEVIARASAEVEAVPPGWMVLLETREDVRALLDLDEYIDLIIPRGSNEFVRYIMENTRIPVMGHADGVCHVYVDEAADLDKAVRVVVDSKTQYVAVCNAAEALLVHRDIAAPFFARALALLEAEEHFYRFGSHLTDPIFTEDAAVALKFLHSVDSASVLHNASTRFADGFRYGLGAEVGISTNRLHSRGPVGLEGLTIYKYILTGDGHTVDDFEGKTPRPYTHRRLRAEW